MGRIRYLSVCSGIEAATVAWHPLAWQPVAFAEIEKFPAAVLAHHYPHVPNLGDITNFRSWPDADFDVLVGGTPCQSFSVAGLRKGLADPRGNLALVFLAIAERYQPRWVVWENVPGVLSSSGGRDFGSFLGGLGELGYGWAYRVLDAQYVRVDGHGRAVPQRRRRVFVVGYLGDWRRAAAVLFERESVCGHSPPRRETGEGIAPTIAARTKGGGGLGTDFDCDGGLITRDPMTLAIRGRDGKPDLEWRQDGTANAVLTPNGGRAGIGVGAIAFDSKAGGETGFAIGEVPGALRGEGHGGGHAAIAWSIMPQNSGKDFKARPVEVAQPVMAGGPVGGNQGGDYIQSAWQVRRLTPRECERLQGFPEISKSVRIEICEDEKIGFASSAVTSSPAQSRGERAPVVAHVLIDLEQQHLQLLSLGRCLWSANIAERPSSSPLSTHLDGFVRLAVLMTTNLVQVTDAGRAVSRQNINGSFPQWNGSAHALVSGQEIDELAADAVPFTSAMDRCMKSITSEAGRNSLTCGSTLRISSCCAALATRQFIPAEIRAASSYAIVIESVGGYTLIPVRGKPAADGPRYKALGNSMAVNCMRWLGHRIEMVEDAVALARSAA